MFYILLFSTVTMVTAMSMTTTPFPGNTTTVINCTSENGSLLYHLETKQCYPDDGGQGPCSNNLNWRPSKTVPENGVCRCDLSFIDTVFVSVPTVLHKKNNRCYQLYSRAFCQYENEWLTFEKDEGGASGRFKCVQNPCINQTTLKYPVWVDGARCVELGSPCSTANSFYGPRIGFYGNAMIPTCDKHRLTPAYLASNANLKCGPGQVKDSYGDCQYVVDLDTEEPEPKNNS